MIVVSGAAHVVLGGAGPAARCDPTPFLRERKSRKFMGLQDELAVSAAGEALARAALPAPLGERAGLYLAVGFIPFERRDAEPVLAGSLDAAGHFDMRRFSADGYTRAHPLLAFRCLPNMPAFHVSANFGIEGAYLVTYPGPGQLYLALQEACAALERDELELALCGGVAHQRNFLVEHHFARLVPPVAAAALRDAAAFLVLERAERVRARAGRALALLQELQVEYRAFDPRSEQPEASEHVEGALADEEGAAGALEHGPAAMLIALSRRIAAAGAGWSFGHRQRTRDGYLCKSRWSAP